MHISLYLSFLPHKNEYFLQKKKNQTIVDESDKLLSIWNLAERAAADWHDSSLFWAITRCPVNKCFTFIISFNLTKTLQCRCYLYSSVADEETEV